MISSSTPKAFVLRASRSRAGTPARPAPCPRCGVRGAAMKALASRQRPFRPHLGPVAAALRDVGLARRRAGRRRARSVRAILPAAAASPCACSMSARARASGDPIIERDRIGGGVVQRAHERPCLRDRRSRASPAPRAHRHRSSSPASSRALTSPEYPPQAPQCSAAGMRVVDHVRPVTGQQHKRRESRRSATSPAGSSPPPRSRVAGPSAGVEPGRGSSVRRRVVASPARRAPACPHRPGLSPRQRRRTRPPPA